MFAPADYVLRPLTGGDEGVLWEMLYQALSPPEGEAPSREIMQRPEYARYVEGWGRPADKGYVVQDKEARTLGRDIVIAELVLRSLPNWCERIRNSRRSYYGSGPTVPRCDSLSDSALRLPARALNPLSCVERSK